MKPQSNPPTLAEQIAWGYGGGNVSPPLPNPFHPAPPPGRAIGPKPTSEQEEQEQLAQFARDAYRW